MVVQLTRAIAENEREKSGYWELRQVQPDHLSLAEATVAVLCAQIFEGGRAWSFFRITEMCLLDRK